MFTPTARSMALRDELLDFMDSRIYPAKPRYAAEMREAGDPHHHPDVLEELKTEARRRGLWNLFHPHPNPEWGSPGLTNWSTPRSRRSWAAARCWAPRHATAPLPTPATWRPSSCSATRSTGHAGWIVFDEVRVPSTDILKGEGEGFAIAQARLGPGRIHHCMRILGVAERALEAMCRRAGSRSTFGLPLSERANVQDWIAESRIAIDQARLLTLHAASLMDTVGNKAAATEIAASKVAVPQAALQVIDRAIQVHGGAGVTDDFPLAAAWAHVRTLRIADGPDEVHKRSIARHELRRHREALDAC